MEEDTKAEKVIAQLSENFKVVSAHRVHAWYSWAAAGLVLGILVGIAYVANRSGQVDAGRASEGELAALHFLSASNDALAETNPVLKVKSLNQEGSPAPVAFSYSLEGTEDWKPLDVHYNIGSFEPGVYAAVPDVFTEKVEFNEAEREINFTDPLEAGNYVIRATRLFPGEDSLTAQAWNKPIVPVPPAYARFSFTPAQPFWMGSNGNFSAPNTAPFCGIDKLELIELGPQVAQNPVQDDAGDNVYVYKYGFRIQAILTSGSDASACQEGQQVKSTVVYNSDSPDSNKDIYIPTLYAGTGQSAATTVPGWQNFTGGTHAELLNATGISKLPPGSLQRSCPADGVDFCPDDYNAPSKGFKTHSPTSIIWTDYPGSVVFQKDKLPLTFEAKFKHYINGTPATGGVWTYKFQPGSPSWRLAGPSQTFTIEQRPAGNSVACGSQLRITVDETGKKPTYDFSTDCGKTLSSGVITPPRPGEINAQ